MSKFPERYFLAAGLALVAVPAFGQALPSPSFTSVTTSSVSSAAGLTLAPGAAANLTTLKSAPAGSALATVGGTTPNINTFVPIHIAPSTTWTNISTTAGFYQNNNLNGSNAGNVAAFYNYLNVNDAVADASNQGGTTLAISMSILNAGSSGPKNALATFFGMSAASGNVIGHGGSYSAGQFTASVNVNDNGLSSNSSGFLYGINPVAHLRSGATFWNSLNGNETDIAVDSGASVEIKVGAQIVELSSDAVQGTKDDIGLALDNQAVPTSTTGWKTGLSFGRWGGQFSVSTVGTMIGAQANQQSAFTVGYGIDWRLGTFTNGSFATATDTIDGSGNLRLGPGWIKPGTGGLTIDSTGSYGTAGAVVAGGTGYPLSATVTGFTDTHGGMWKITTDGGGAVTAVTLQSAPYVQSGLAASTCTGGSPCALTTPSFSTGSGATISVTWQTGTQTAFTGNTTATGTATFGTGQTINLSAAGASDHAGLTSSGAGYMSLSVGSNSGVRVMTSASGFLVGKLQDAANGANGNYWQLNNAATGSAVAIGVGGGVDATVALNLVTKGSGVLQINGTAGVTCSGSPTVSFATVGGLVTHC